MLVFLISFLPIAIALVALVSIGSELRAIRVLLEERILQDHDA